MLGCLLARQLVSVPCVYCVFGVFAGAVPVPACDCVPAYFPVLLLFCCCCWGGGGGCGGSRFGCAVGC